jgi:hypothetical protein
MDDTACPWPIRRCHALMILRALTAEVCERLDQALAESEETEFDHEERFDHAIAESEQAEFDREESRRKWRERREGTIETFHLAGLVDEEAPSV